MYKSVQMFSSTRVKTEEKKYINKQRVYHFFFIKRRGCFVFVTVIDGNCECVILVFVMFFSKIFDIFQFAPCLYNLRCLSFFTEKCKYIVLCSYIKKFPLKVERIVWLTCIHFDVLLYKTLHKFIWTLAKCNIRHKIRKVVISQTAGSSRLYVCRHVFCCPILKFMAQSSLDLVVYRQSLTTSYS